MSTGSTPYRCRFKLRPRGCQVVSHGRGLAGERARGENGDGYGKVLSTGLPDGVWLHRLCSTTGIHATGGRLVFFSFRISAALKIP
ncbi:uncharacterized protein GLRG_04855 [Colletotrichum graminicola M1.001]|uniref:Uncharacterized protein n=1 Tax=Colletotrichum graminicola (strain M1.001 / M2 / FGSC 10212) TaxID=645133 RepID=E3QGB5_COLGM|nr:uncharacterized protein GLRG_04855 [Colletotrichum graminicola M1.001]EFQ29711.1 hypothetical protein GLRG_04855 [Colletotrichum graminicola M1.001]